jgi:hypothetical protein
MMVSSRYDYYIEFDSLQIRFNVPVPNGLEPSDVKKMAAHLIPQFSEAIKEQLRLALDEKKPKETVTLS